MRKKMFHKYHSSWIILLSWNAVVVVWLLSLEAVVVAANGSKSPQPLTPSDPHHYSRSSFGAIPTLGGGSLVVDQDPRIQAAATSGDDHDHDVVVDVDDVGDDGDDGATAAAVVLIPEPEAILQPVATRASTSTIQTTSKQKRSQPSPTQTIQPKQRDQQSDPITFNMGTFPSIESLLADENFTNFLENFSTGNPSLLPSDYPSGSSSPSSLFNSQYFLPSSSNTPTGSLYPVDLNNLLPPPPSSASNQYYYNGQQPQHNYNYHPNNNNNNNGNGNGNNNNSNNNKTSSGLGRRIGELVSNSAERATRALKSFPKLLNDIKPSKLWGWSSMVDTTDLTPKHNISSIPFHSISSAWYSPQNTWSSFAPPPITSSVYFQQPVFVRTHDANPTMQSPSPMQTNQILSPSTSPSSSSLLSPSSSSASSLLSSASSLSSSTGNGNRFLSQQNVYPNTNDLYASAQTVYGNRVKPPTTVHQFGEYDNGSNEDINSIGSGTDSDSDTKMANEGQLTDHMEEQGRINTVIMPQDHNGVPASNNDPNNNNNNNGVWPPQRQPSPSTYEDYGGEPGNQQQDYYNHQSAGNGNNGQNGFQNSVRFPASNGRRPNPMTTSSQAYRRPYNNWDMDDLESWYPTAFFGSSANTLKPMGSRFRTTGGFNTPSSFTTNSLLAAASTTPTATSVAADYLPFVSTTAGMFPRQSDQLQAAAAAASPASYYPIAAAPVGPRWPFTGFYPGAGFNPFLNHNVGGYYGYRPLATAPSMMRPVSVMPFYPQMNNYYRPSYRPAAPFVGSASTLYGSYALNPFLNTAGLINPYHRPTFTSPPQVSPFNSLVAAASSLYPVRVPFPAIQPSPLSYNTIIPAPITSMPILRHRIGTIKSKRSQQPSDWKRNDLLTGTGSEHSPKYSKKPESTKSPSSSSSAAAAGLSLTENRNPKQQSKQQRSNDPSDHDQQLASIYKTIQMFQSKPSSSMVVEDEQNENNHRSVFSFLNQPPSEYRYYLKNHTQHYDHNKNHVVAEPPTTKTTTTPSSSSSSQSSSIDQMLEDGGGQPLPSSSSSSSSSSAADTTTSTTTMTNSSTSFRLMRAHRHIGQKQVEQTNKPSTKSIQPPKDNKIPRKTINPKWSDPIGSNEWKPLFRSLLRPTTSSSSTKLDP